MDGGGISLPSSSLMKRISPAESFSLKQSLLSEFCGETVFLGFTFHFSSRKKASLESIAANLGVSGFKFVRIADASDKEHFMLELSRIGDGDLSYLAQLDTALLDICLPHKDVDYLGATPFGERLPDKRKE